MTDLVSFDKRFGDFVDSFASDDESVVLVTPPSNLIDGSLMVRGAILIDSGFGSGNLQSALVCFEGNSLYVHAPLEWNEVSIFPERFAAILLPLQLCEVSDEQIKNQTKNSGAIELFLKVKFEKFHFTSKEVRLAVLSIARLPELEGDKWELLSETLNSRKALLESIPVVDEQTL